MKVKLDKLVDRLKKWRRTKTGVEKRVDFNETTFVETLKLTKWAKSANWEE